MTARICKCCGESMSETGNDLSRNPNLCASCSSMEDGEAGSQFQQPKTGQFIELPAGSSGQSAYRVRLEP